jgi:glutamyl/glutaminyl-tRNA synthetase
MGGEEVKEILDKLEALLDEIEEKDYVKDKLEKIIMPKAEEWGSVEGKVDRGRILWPLRVALTGQKASPGPFEVAEILGKKRCLQRVREAKNIS